MAKSKISLDVTELEDILDLVKKFPNVKSVDISTERCAGIGTITKIKIPTTIHDVAGTFTVEITGVADW